MRRLFISIEDEKIKIGPSEGSIKEVKRENLKFSPNVGDNVDIYEDKSEIIIIKSDDIIDDKVEDKLKKVILLQLFYCY